MGVKYGKMESAYNVPIGSILMTKAYAAKLILSAKSSTSILANVKVVTMVMSKLMVNAL